MRPRAQRWCGCPTTAAASRSSSTLILPTPAPVGDQDLNAALYLNDCFSGFFLQRTKADCNPFKLFSVLCPHFHRLISFC
jgi:hypothetical protein